MTLPLVAQPPLLNAQRSALLVTVVTLLASIYMLTYSGRMESGDGLSMFDASASFVRHGDFLLGLSASERPPKTFDSVSLYPLNSVDIEPLEIVLAAPLYWVADKLPGVGLVHTVWLFNAIVCALVGGVFYLYALTLGYSESVAVFGALNLGLATILWPYSKTFFREPLAALLLLAAGLSAEHWRRNSYHSYLMLSSLLVSIVGVLLTKASAVLALPTLIVIAIPNFRRIPWMRLLIGLLLALTVAAGIFLLLAFIGDTLGVGQRYSPLLRAIFGPSQSFYHLFQAALSPVQRLALHGYLVSPGGSIWGTSPVILLAVPGFWWLSRHRQYRYLIVAVLLIIAFAAGYARLAGHDWFGGLSWPPRFLVPIVPFLALGTLPVWGRLCSKPFPRLLAVVAGLLLIYSLWVQLSGVTLWWGDYTTTLPPQARGRIEWPGGMNQVQYFRWVTILSLWGRMPLDFAWVRVDTPGWALALTGLAAVCAAWLIVLLKRPRYLRATAVLPLAWLMLAWLGLRAINHDIFYQPFDQTRRDALETAMAYVEAESSPGDVLLISYGYKDFFRNHGRIANSPRMITLPFQPGEQPSPAQPASVVSDNPDALVYNFSIPFFSALAATRERLWLLAETGPFHWWSIRPVERYMAMRYYPIRVIEFDPAVRLIEYSTIAAPDPYSFRGPERLTDIVFGESIRLAGYELPAGTSYYPGDVLALSLYWQTDAPLEQDYTVAFFLTDGDGLPEAQGHDWQPAMGFMPTSGWRPGVPVWDNRAVRLPDDLAAGEYQLWVKVYGLDSSNIPHDLPVTGGRIINESIAVLDTTIEVHTTEQ